MSMNIRTVITTVILSVIILIPTARGQNNRVSNAIQAYAAGEYQKAYELSGDALANLDELSGDYVAAAYYYLAKSRIQVLRLAVESGNQEKLSGMQNALVESYFDYKEALKTADNKLQTDIIADLSGLYNPILQTGLSALNTANDPGQASNVREAALKAARGYLAAAKDISPTYLACDLLGQVHLALGDSLGAQQLFAESIAAYKNKTPVEADFLMAYVFFRKAMIERYGQQNNRLALATLMDGQNLLNNEFGKHTANGTLSAQDRQAYDNGMTDLIGFELDIYLNDPTLKDDAIVRFQEVLVLFPEDYDIHVAYANLLEDIDLLLAIDAYETAISIDDSKELAFFNLGAVYNNLGSEYYLQGLNEDDDAVADSLYNEANNYFRSAYTYMEQAYHMDPFAIQTIRALVQLANSLGLDEQSEFYKKKEMDLRGF
ncbi:MAG: hypothetical protein DRJ15_12660 [Bacteroidetes bacterium]|nr:MAG: hypothetical protein DRJ15_12660 [Bacteroidota bacterium]